MCFLHTVLILYVRDFFVCVSVSPLELPVGSCLRTLLPGSTTAKQMRGQRADMSEITD